MKVRFQLELSPADNRPWFGNEVGQFPHSTNKTFMVPHPGTGHLANGYCFLITSFGLGNQKTSFICFQCAFSVLVHCCKVATFVCLFLLLLQSLWLKETDSKYQECKCKCKNIYSSMLSQFV